MQAALVRDLKTNLVIMVCCGFSAFTPTSGTPLGLSNVLGVMATKGINKEMQYSNWTMDTNLSQRGKEYGTFDAYVMWNVRNIVDQRLHALVVPHFLVQFDTYSSF